MARKFGFIQKIINKTIQEDLGMITRKKFKVHDIETKQVK
jgi:hypothetical protein